MNEQDMDPAAALEAARASRRSISERLDDGPWWFDAVYAGSAGGIIAFQALPIPYNNLGVALCTVALALSYNAWRRRTGISVLGFTPKRARWVAAGLGVVIIATFFVVFALKSRLGLWWAPLAGGVVAGLAAHLFSRLWVSVYRRELEQGA